MKYVDASVTVIVIVPATASTFKLYTVEYKVLAEPTNIVTVGLPVKMKLPPVPERSELDETIETVATADDEKIKLSLGVVTDAPLRENKLVPDSAPRTVTALPFDVIVDDTATTVRADAAPFHTIESAVVAVNNVLARRETLVDSPVDPQYKLFTFPWILAPVHTIV